MIRKSLPLQITLIIIAQFLLFVNIATATAIPEVIPNTYVYDGATVIEEAQEADLNSKLRSLEQDTTAEIFVVTVAGLDGEAIEDFSYRTANEMGIGQAEYDNGVLLLVSPPEGTRNVRIEVGKGMEGIFNDAKVGRILDTDFVPYRAEGNYQDGITKTVDSLIAETRDNAEWIGKTVDDEGNLLIFALFTPLAIIIPLAFFASAYKTGKQEITRKKLADKRGIWTAIAIGIATMRRNNENWRSKHSGDNWHGGGSSGGWLGGGSGGGSFGGGGATR